MISYFLINFREIHYRLHGTCNHIAGLLFRVEYAVRTGLTSSTSNQCKWDVPTNQKPGPGNPTPLVDFKWKKAHYFNQGVYPKISFGSGSSLLLKISYCQNQRRPMYFMPLNMAQEIKPETIVICSMHFNGNIYLHLYTFFIFTRGQFWPSGIVVACVCLCVRLCVR